MNTFLLKNKLGIVRKFLFLTFFSIEILLTTQSSF